MASARDRRAPGTSRVLVFTSYGGPEYQELIEREIPRPGPGELLIEVRAAGVNPADAKMRQGLFGTKRSLPSPLGLEGSGIVLAVGDGVEGFTEGDAVLGAAARGEGTFADHALLSAAKSTAKPEGVSFPDAAVLPVAGAVAYDVVHQTGLGPGGALVVLGAGGGVGLMALQAGAAHGLRVIGVASDAKRDLVESAGAEFITSGHGAAARVREIAPDGADLVVDLVGGQALREIAPAAKHPAQIVTTVDPATAEQLGGSALQRTNGALEAITELARQRAVDPHVRRRFSLSDAHQAMAAVEAGHSAGKVVIEP